MKQVANFAGYVIEYNPDEYEGSKFSFYWMPNRLTHFETGVIELYEYLNKRRFTFDEAVKLCKLIREFTIIVK